MKARGIRAAAAALMCAFLLALAGCAVASGPAVPVRAAVDDYTWAELAQLSEQIAAADDEQATALAREYHLVGADGALDGSQAKEVALADGTQTRAVVAGLRQDAGSDGSLRGITMMLEGAVGPRPMNDDAGFSDVSDETAAGTAGAWPACEARGWLNSDFADLLPDDLDAAIKETRKASIAVSMGDLRLDDDDAVKAGSDELMAYTADRLWLASLSEVAGVSDNTAAAEVEVFPAWRDLLRMEGAQYQLFADAGVHEEEASALLAKRLVSSGHEGEPCSWWLRTAEDAVFYGVSKDGVADRLETAASPGEPRGLVVFFCL